MEDILAKRLGMIITYYVFYSTKSGMLLPHHNYVSLAAVGFPADKYHKPISLTVQHNSYAGY
jgi:hypothetical protein